MGKFLFVVVYFMSSLSQAAQVEQESPCPQTELERCRWTIKVRVEKPEKIVFEWEKSILSRRREKPLASALQCNVDREFDAKAGGYIRVWFEGEKAHCDPMAGPPQKCGVSFLLDELGNLESSRGFTVEAPAGKRLAQVEHLSTLRTQCGDFQTKKYSAYQWKSLIGWKRGYPGDGSYSENFPLN